MALSARVIFSASTNYADVNLPELVSAEILADGGTFQMVFTKAVTFGGGGNGGFVLDTDGAAVTLTYSSGDGTTTLVFTLSRTVLDTETVTDFDYTQPGDGVVDLSDRELTSFSNQQALVENSSGEDGISWLLEENFEGSQTDGFGVTGYDTAGVTTSSASVNPNYATSPAPLEGSYSLYPGTSSRWARIPCPGGPRSFFLLFRPLAITATTTFRLRSGGADVAIIELTSGSKIKPTHGTVAGTAMSDTVTTGTTLSLWIDYAPATSGSNGVLAVGFGTTVKPTSGNKYSAITNGDSTLEVDEIQVGGLGSQVIFDKLRGSIAEITGVPS